MISKTSSALRRCLLAAAGLALAISSLPNSRADLQDGLLNYWDFEGGFDDTAGHLPGNASTSRDRGTAGAGVVLTPAGPFGMFGDFTRGDAAQINNVVSVPDSADVVAAGESLSVSVWFRVTNFDEDWQALIAHGEGSDWRVARRGGDLVMAYAGGTGDIPGTAIGPVVNDGLWHHLVAISENGVSSRLWVDGGLVETGGAPAIGDNGAGRMMIGGNPNAGFRAWNGGIDDVAMWDRPLTDAEIMAIYDAGSVDGKSLRTVISEGYVDADGDGLPDIWEVANLGAGADADDGTTNPDFGPGGDPDMDDSTNAAELARGTDPTDDDSDDDGYKDGVETNTGFWDSVTETGTDPLNPDSDGDTLLDGVENPDLPFIDENQTGSDPNLVDTDMDTFPDDVEVAAGTDPNNAAEFPGLGGLPIVDDFEDNDFNELLWLANTGIVTGGAAITEVGGHLSMTGRAHLYTRQEFDPIAEGGLYITGKWTFTGGDDFLQILTRSDGLPDPGNCCGETLNGIEFFASQPGNGVGIRLRGGQFALAGNQSLGAISLNAGTTYEFYIIDDGANNLGFCLWEEGNRANAQGVQDSLTASAATSNHVAFHNREGARSSNLEEIEIGVLVDSEPDGIPDFWEVRNGLEVGTDDGGEDKDMDGLTNLQEYQLCLDPCDDDTDDDGLLDGVETFTGVYVNAMNTGTNPLIADTDGDGLLDGVEDNGRVFVNSGMSGTDPNNPDTDGDLISDGAEVAGGLDPNVPNEPLEGVAVGLVNYWCFDNESLEDIAHSQGLGESSVPDDGVFSGVNGTDGIGFGPGLFNGGIELNGAGGGAAGNENDGVVRIARSADTLFGANATNVGSPNTVTTSMWVQAAGFDSSWQTMLSHGEGSQYRIARRGGDVPETAAYAGGSGDIPGAGVGPSIGVGTGWHHIVAISEGGVSTRLWVDGGLVATGAAPVIDDARSGSALDLFIGGNPDTGANNREWWGEIDDVAQWNRVLEDAEITSIFESGLAGGSLKDLLGGGPVSDFRITRFTFDEDSGDIAITWRSREGKFYRIAYTTDLGDWDIDLDDGFPGAVGAEETTFSFNRADLLDSATAPRVEFRVEEIQ